jgi:hypothetical protein
VPSFPTVRFSGPLSEPDVHVSAHPALHKTRGSCGVLTCVRPRRRDVAAPTPCRFRRARTTRSLWPPTGVARSAPGPRRAQLDPARVRQLLQARGVLRHVRVPARLHVAQGDRLATGQASPRDLEAAPTPLPRRRLVAHGRRYAQLALTTFYIALPPALVAHLELGSDAGAGSGVVVAFGSGRQRLEGWACRVVRRWAVFTAAPGGCLVARALEGVDFARLRADDREGGRLFRLILIGVEVCMGCRWLGMSGRAAWRTVRRSRRGWGDRAGGWSEWW